MITPASIDANRLPVPRTALVGRRREVEEVSSLLLRPDVPMVTIVGPGGAGKTRIALTVAHELATSFRDGVWWVSLGSIYDPQLVVPTVAETLGIRDTSDLPVEQRLHSRLHGTETLIVIDNMEHVRDAAFGLAELLHCSTAVKLLVTSRTVLRLSVEHVYAIAGLPLPRRDHTPTFDELQQNEAVQFFTARAQAANPMFRLQANDGPAVLDICRRLDGLPLALELAAARTRILSPQALQADLSQRLTLLSGGPKDHPRRHQTIRDTVDWSVQLMDPAEQTMFRRLAVFAGAFTAPMAAAVAVFNQDDTRVDDTGIAGGDVADNSLVTMYETLTSLLDQSLVHRVSTSIDEPRFRLLQTIREVALEQLEASGEAEAMKRRHAHLMLSLAEEATPHLTGGEQARWLTALDRSIDDLRAALAWFRQHDEREMELRLAVGLWRFGYTRGHLSETREWLEAALERNPAPTAQRVAALNGLGLLASAQGDTDTAVASHTEAIEISRMLENQHGIAIALNGLGDAAAAMGDRASARERYQAALGLFRELGALRGVAGAFTNLGNLAWDEHDLDEAVALHEQARGLYEEIDERRGLAWSASNLGTLAAQQGRTEDARRYLQNALRLYEELGDRSGVLETMEGYAEIAHLEGRPEVAAMLFSTARAIRDEIGTPISASAQERYNASIERVRAELGTAFERYWAEGQAMSSADAIAAALSLGDAPPTALWRPQPKGASAHGLSRREIEVVRLIAEGRTSKEIAETLFISVRTVGTHISNIFGKLGVSSRSALTAFAHREGLV